MAGTVESTVLHYDIHCVDDLHAMLKKAEDRVEPGGAGEQSRPGKAPSRRGAAPLTTRSAADAD